MVHVTNERPRPRRLEEDPDRAWAPFAPDARRPWTPALAGHLLRRAGFGAGPAPFADALAGGPRRAVDALLRPATDTAAFDRRYDEYEQAATGSGPPDGVRVWWLRRMIEAPDVLRERMVLFWHGHLAADAGQMKEPRTMQRHLALLRRHALGSYRVLLEAITVESARPTTPRRLAGALYRTFVSEVGEPPPALVAPLERALERDEDVGRIVETILRSNAFFSPLAFRRRIKSPVELAVGLVRSLEGMVSTTVLALDLARLGQSLLHPPGVEGWAGGRHWIDRVSLLRRRELTEALVSEGGRYGGKLDPARIAGEHGGEDVRAGAEFLRDLLLPGLLDAAAADALDERLDEVVARTPSATLRHVARVLVTLPEYQLA